MITERNLTCTCGWHYEDSLPVRDQDQACPEHGIREPQPVDETDPQFPWLLPSKVFMHPAEIARWRASEALLNDPEIVEEMRLEAIAENGACERGLR